jgi:hypothetical protein
MISSAITLTQLKARPGNLNNALAVMLGKTATGDNGAAIYYWNPGSTATADDINIVQVTGIATGRWLRMINAATDAEAQISVIVTEDYKLISRLKLFNWWNWVKTQAVTITNTITGNVFNIATTPATSAGSYDLLTRNTSNGIVEKIPANTYNTPVATTAVPGKVLMTTASSDAAGAVGATYSQAEVQAILNELRDLKTKMRTAGLLQ